MKKNARLKALGAAAGVAALVAAGAVASAQDAAKDAGTAKDQSAKSGSCSGDDGGITLPPGFCATIFADHIGHARHLVVSPDNTLYVNTWSGRYYKNDKPHDGGFLVALKDTAGTGKANKIERFGGTAADGDHGGTGIALWDDKVFAETNDKIVSYDLAKGDIAPKGKARTIVSGMPVTGDHPMHPFVISKNGEIFVDLGSATNACQEKNRMPHAKGIAGCEELKTRGGIWKFDAGKTDQVFGPETRYATGLRNGEGLAFDASGRLFATQHGRDQLFENWPELYKQPQGAALPSEEVVEVKQDADFGWPYCYYDPDQKKLVLAPEYGGDGGKKVGVCAEKTGPVSAFPAHWAPNDLAIYRGGDFPKAYVGAALVAFHGSWNRAPAPQGGYNVVLQPLADGKASGKYEVFADGFAGPDKNPGQAKHRPSGLAIGPDGALYIADDIQGTIWRVTYQGDKSAGIAAAPSTKEAKAAPGAEPPEGTHPDAGAQEAAAALTPPPGATKEQVALGAKIFFGEKDGGTCAGCHGNNAKGTPIGPTLIKDKWEWGDGSVDAIANTITQGVMEPKNHPGAMPPMGGAAIPPDDVKAVASYVWALNH